jgi:DNA-binding MarR family transcriptional regulator
MKKKGSSQKKQNLTQTTGFTLWQVCNLWQRELRKALLPLDLTHAQYLLLQSACELSNGEDDITQIKLAQDTNTDKMMVSKVLRTLETKKLLKRADLKTDNRAKKITVTPKGIEMYEKAKVVVEAFEAEFFLPAAKNEKALTKALGKLLKNQPEVEDTK